MSNKKYDWGYAFGILGFSLLVFAGLFCLFLLVVMVTQNPITEDKACKNLGFEKYTLPYYSNFGYCVDYEGNYHYAKIKCERFLGWERNCQAKLISIGDVRVVQNEIP